MASWLDSLLALQEVDLHIRNLKKRLAMIPRERNDLKDKRTLENELLDNAKSAIQETELKLKGYEALMIKHYDAIAKLQQKATQVRRNDEYQALMKEIDFNKAKISDLETDTLVQMDKLDTMKKNFVTRKSECAAQLSNIDAEIESLTALEHEVREMLEDLTEVRNERKSKVSEPALSIYERILKKNTDTPAVKIINGNICGNCRLKLTPQTLGTAKAGNLANCDHCSHIVYLAEEA